jgi:hypothetical protein
MKNIQTFEDFFSGREKTSDVNEEAEGRMYKGRVMAIIDNAQKFLDMLGDDEDMDAWVQDKIVIADHNMDAIVGYYQSEKGKEKEAPAAMPTVPGKPKLIIDKK